MSPFICCVTLAPEKSFWKFAISGFNNELRLPMFLVVRYVQANEILLINVSIGWKKK